MSALLKILLLLESTLLNICHVDSNPALKLMFVTKWQTKTCFSFWERSNIT